MFGSAPGHPRRHPRLAGAPNSPFGGFAPLGGAGTGLATGSNPDGRVELFSMTLPVTHAWQVAPNRGWAGFIPLD